MNGDDPEMDPAEAQRVGAIARSLQPSDFELDEPPADLWADIEAAAGLGERSNVTRLRRRPMRSVALAAVGVAAAVLLAIGLVAVNGDGPESGDIVASTSLDLLDTPFDGRAELIETADGLELKVEVEDLRADQGQYLELWLIGDLETGTMQSLGPLDGDGRFSLPPGLDPAEFSVVDVSFESFDGDPTHSGNSTLRGELSL